MNPITQTQVINGITITREQIEDTMRPVVPRRYYYRLSELVDHYKSVPDSPIIALGARRNEAYRVKRIVYIKNALLSHDHKQGVNALPKHTTVYRVALHPDRDDIEVVSIGMERGDTTPDTVYANFSCLPRWMQERLQVMIMLDDTAPTEHVEGLGRRISKYVFWLEIPNEENKNG